ncbi:MAG: hypothetical protein JO242_20300 [Streptosporangiaceae bacterium]|nr:hypothetical protein [Streptosporangiaceae bacterium]
MPGSAPPAGRQSVDDVALWYHTLELPGGVVTPGWFDLRGVVGRLPWPEVRGKRCLDVGTYDGFYAFELERRGAREVVATDIARHEDWDLPAPGRSQAEAALRQLAGEKGLGFEVAREVLGSRVEKRILSVYDLSPDRVGTFDVVVCGNLMLHLRDPVRALEAIRSVCTGRFMSIEEVSLGLSIALRKRAVAELRLDPRLGQWWVPNAAGHARVVAVAGFEVIEQMGPFSEPFGAGHPPRGRGAGPLALRLARQLLAGGDGVPHAALLARPVI